METESKIPGKGTKNLPPIVKVYSRTCIAMEYMISIQALLEKVSLVVIIDHPEKPFTVGLE